MDKKKLTIIVVFLILVASFNLIFINKILKPTPDGKRIIEIPSNSKYNSKTYIDIPETKNPETLYKIEEDKKTPVKVTHIDRNNDGYIDRLEWTANPDETYELKTINKKALLKKLKKHNFKDIEKNYDRFDLKTDNLELYGVENLNSIKNVFHGPIEDEKVKTEVVAVNPLDIKKAKIRLKKYSDVNRIMECKNFNFNSRKCNKWSFTDIPFTDLGDYIGFDVPGFSAYAGGFDEGQTESHYRLVIGAITAIGDKGQSASYILNLSGAATPVYKEGSTGSHNVSLGYIHLLDMEAVRMEIEIFMVSNVSKPSTTVRIYGRINLTDGTNVANTPIEIWLNDTLLNITDLTPTDSYTIKELASDSSSTDFNKGTYSNTTTDNENITLINNTATNDYELIGNFTSQIFDANYTANWTTIEFTASNASALDNVSLEVRSCDDSSCVGESWSIAYWSSPSTLNENLNRYFQYRATLATDDTSITPYLEEVAINYTFVLTNSSGDYDYEFTSPSQDNFYPMKVNATYGWIYGEGEENLTVDSVEPLVDLDYPPDNQWFNVSSVTFNYTITDDYPDTCELWANWTGSFVFNQSSTILTNASTNNFTNLTLEDGIYLWGVFCNDSANNQDWSINRTLGIDTVAPSNFTLEVPANNTISTNLTPFLNWSDTVEINLDTYVVEVDNLHNFTNIDYTYNTSNSEYQVGDVGWIGDITWYWRVFAHDYAGNINDSSEVNTYIIDVTLPVISLVSPSNDSTVSTNTVDFKYVATNPHLDACELWGDWSGHFIKNMSSSNVTSGNLENFTLNLADGSYTWNVKCNDTVANENFAPANNTFTVSKYEVSKTYVAGGGGGGAGKREVLVALDIISPAPINIYRGDTIIAPIIIKNIGHVGLHNINIEAISATPGLTVSLTETHIERLLPDQEKELDLEIEATPTLTSPVGTITIRAVVGIPAFTDTAQFFVSTMDIGIRKKTIVLQRLELLKALLEENPECLELTELLKKAQTEFEAEKYDEALNTIETAIASCTDLTTLELKKLEKPKGARYTFLILLLEVIIFFVVFGTIYRYYRRRLRK